MCRNQFNRNPKNKKYIIDIKLDEKRLQQIKNVQYLELMLNRRGYSEVEIKSRFLNGAQLYHSIKTHV